MNGREITPKRLAGLAGWFASPKYKQIKAEQNMKTVTCPNCEGSGTDIDLVNDDIEEVTCPTCKGSGIIRVKQ
jgi:DnaJ-class molecular chaperone